MPRQIIQPNVHSRIRSLDVLRGLAVLGILLANIPTFSGPVWAAMMSGEMKSEPAGIIEVLTSVFVTGKFRTPLAIMFGVGLILQYQRRVEIPGAWPGGYLKRNFFLAILGLLHMIFIWSGDILFMYAMGAFVAVWFAKVKENILMILAIVGISFFTLAAAILAIAFADPAIAAMMSSNDTKWLTTAEELRVFGSGSYLDQVIFRLKIAAPFIPQAIFLAPVFGSYFLLGMWLGKIGFFTNPSEHPKVRAWLLWLGLGLGLLLNLVSFTVLGKPLSMSMYIYAEAIAGPLLGIGYLALAAVIVERVRNGFTDALEKVGKMALTAYLLQSLIATTIFYSFGLGLFNETTSAQDLLFVVLIWAIVIAVCNFWMNRFTIGPVEWAWRSATEFRILPWKVGPPIMAGGPPPTIESSASLPDSSVRSDTDRVHADPSNN